LHGFELVARDEAKQREAIDEEVHVVGNRIESSSAANPDEGIEEDHGEDYGILHNAYWGVRDTARV